MTGEVNLLPCAFCDGNGADVQIEDDGYAYVICVCTAQGPLRKGEAEAIAAWNTRPTLVTGQLQEDGGDHALICWAMCVQDACWEEWVPFDCKGEFCFAGIKYTTSLDDFGCPKLTPALRTAITQSQNGGQA